MLRADPMNCRTRSRERLAGHQPPCLPPSIYQCPYANGMSCGSRLTLSRMAGHTILRLHPREVRSVPSKFPEQRVRVCCNGLSNYGNAQPLYRKRLPAETLQTISARILQKPCGTRPFGGSPKDAPITAPKTGPGHSPNLSFQARQRAVVARTPPSAAAICSGDSASR